MTGLDGKENFLYEYGFDWLVTMSMVIAVGLGGLIGAMARFLIVETVVQFLPNEHSYWGTVTVNLLGCFVIGILIAWSENCLLYTSPSPRDLSTSRMPSSA